VGFPRPYRGRGTVQKERGKYNTAREGSHGGNQQLEGPQYFAMRHLTSGHSIFTYPLGRRYPNSSITWIVIAGGLTLAVLFSFVAAASNAYEFQSRYTSDPNGTVNHKHWFQKAPFTWINTGMESTCQSIFLTVGADYLTTTGAFVYTLDLAAQNTQNGGPGQMMSAVAYRNSTLNGCVVSEIRIDLARNDYTRLAGNGWSWGATNAGVSTLKL
jgi:hypothetical protein